MSFAITLTIGALASTGLAVWFVIGVTRVHAGRAKNLIEGMTPQRIVYRRLSREIHEKHGR